MIASAMLIIDRDGHRTGHPVLAEHLTEHGVKVVAAGLARIVAWRGHSATSVLLRVERVEPHGVRVTDWYWSPAEATAEHFEMALSAPARFDQVDDSDLRMRRRVLPGGWTVMTAKEVGPPRWWWPRIGVTVDRHRLWLWAGWNYTAYHLTVHWSWPEAASPEGVGGGG